MLFSCKLLAITNIDQQNQISKEDREIFDISDKFFKICELLDEYDVKSLNFITNKIFITDLCHEKKKLILCYEFCQ